MADEQFGNLSPQDFKDMASLANQIADNTRLYKEAFREVGESARDLNSSLTTQATLATNLSRITATELRDKRAQKKVEDNLNKARGVGQSLAARQSTIQKEIAENSEKLAASRRKMSSLESDILLATGKQKKELLKQRQALVETTNAQEENLSLSQKAGEAIREAREDNEKLVEGYKKLNDQVKKVNSKTKFFDRLRDAATSIPGLGPLIAKPFERASEAAKAAAEDGKGLASTYAAGFKGLGEGLINMLSVPAIMSLLTGASEMVKGLRTSLGLSQEQSYAMLQNMADFASESENARAVLPAMAKSQTELTRASGLNVQFSRKTLENFLSYTEGLGVSVKTMARLETIQRSLGDSSGDFADRIGLAAKEAGSALGINIPLAESVEAIGNASTEVLLNFRRNPEALGKALAASKALGLSLNEINNIGKSLLDFETSIEKELEAELLTGRQINLEKARVAALTGNQAVLTAEIAKNVGTISDYENMNVLQRQSMAELFNMNIDQMGDMLLKQEALRVGGEAAARLSAESIQNARDRARISGNSLAEELKLEESRVTTAEGFKIAADGVKSSFQQVFIKLAPYLESFADGIAKISDSPFMKTLSAIGVGTVAISKIMRIGKDLGLIPQRVFVVNGGALGAMGMGGGRGMYTNTVTGRPRSAPSSAAQARYRQRYGNRAGNRRFGRTATRGMRGAGMGVPIAGGLMSAAGHMMSGEENAVERGLLSGLLTIAGGALGSLIAPGAGTYIGAMLGGMAGDYLGDAMFSEPERYDDVLLRPGESPIAFNKGDSILASTNMGGSSEDMKVMIKLLEEIRNKDMSLYADGNKVGQIMNLSANKSS